MLYGVSGPQWPHCSQLFALAIPLNSLINTAGGRSTPPQFLQPRHWPSALFYNSNTNTVLSHHWPFSSYHIIKQFRHLARKANEVNCPQEIPSCPQQIYLTLIELHLRLLYPRMPQLEVQTKQILIDALAALFRTSIINYCSIPLKFWPPQSAYSLATCLEQLMRPHSAPLHVAGNVTLAWQFGINNTVWIKFYATERQTALNRPLKLNVWLPLKIRRFSTDNGQIRGWAVD